ncbi:MULTISPECIES: hypothetical protein [Acinetobacter calcoaceticus/baumannii complex]|uniref:hypothetical protein n=1 Tax=Acinetobacter calcoaceticus/baumannii complex TaxID=909768 RepID=UPI00226D7B27|nr:MULTISPECIES: hypothetical protein [Acinetobacter calcoaceticus/baumannii complex]MDD9317874.1 hypothetical protein [Acinetobacter lactucae]
MMTEDEFSDWFDKNIGALDKFGAAWQVYEALNNNNNQQLAVTNALDEARLKGLSFIAVHYDNETEEFEFKRVPIERVQIKD